MTDERFTTRGELRIGDRERDEVTRALHEAFAQGRITREELDERLETTLHARTARDLSGVLADLVAPDDPAHPMYRAPAEHRGPGGYPFRGDLATWGHHYYAAQWHQRFDAERRARWEARRRGRHGPPPFVPVILIVALVASIASGMFWPLLILVKIAFFVGLASLIFSLARRHRRT
ncbi:DUF1707 SHOCT-like domain-containing protein [Acrocarpospora catenulata]|uniref:DUF1707 SHOCT-like domain-containing protein n=1 Tax=Acrocarpospora catenulata TaxID=2836182 RepID=UPI001BDA5A68|nr:DUF1707 domain-containing protein [Acrocarpospora catenulata]